MVGDNRTNDTIVCRRKSQILLAPLSVIVGKIWRSFSRIRHVIPILTIFSKVPHLTVTVVSPPHAQPPGYPPIPWVFSMELGEGAKSKT